MMAMPTVVAATLVGQTGRQAKRAMMWRAEVCAGFCVLCLQAGRTAIHAFLEDDQVRVFLLAHKAGAQGETPERR